MLSDSGVASSSPVPSVLALNPRATLENGFAPNCFGADASVEDFLPRRLGFGNKSMLMAGVVAASNELKVVCACDGRLQASRASAIRTTASFVCSMIGPFYLAVRSCGFGSRVEHQRAFGATMSYNLSVIDFHFCSTNLVVS